MGAIKSDPGHFFQTLSSRPSDERSMGLSWWDLITSVETVGSLKDMMAKRSSTGGTLKISIEMLTIKRSGT